jgi:hypothetical protein
LVGLFKCGLLDGPENLNCKQSPCHTVDIHMVSFQSGLSDGPEIVKVE